LDQGRSVETLQVTTAIDGIRAQIAVIYSETWRDQWERNVQTSEQLIEALTQLAPVVRRQITDTELDPSCDPQNILRSTISS
jgi:hypothetical protein